MIIKKSARLVALTASLSALQAGLSPVVAQEQVTIEQFYIDGTHQTDIKFPMYFRSATGINHLNAGNELSKFAEDNPIRLAWLEAFPELGLSYNTYQLDNTTQLKIIQWMNDQGVNIHTKDGNAFTESTLESSANTWVTVLTDAGIDVNRQINDQLQASLTVYHTVGDVMIKAEEISPGSTSELKQAFQVYSDAFYNSNGEFDKDNSLLQPVQQAWGKISQLVGTYHVRQLVGDAPDYNYFVNSAVSTVLTGYKNDVKTIQKTTKFVDLAGKDIKEPHMGDVFLERTDIEGWILLEARTEDNIKTYIYRLADTPQESVSESKENSESESSIMSEESSASESSSISESSSESSSVPESSKPETKPISPLLVTTYWLDTDGKELKSHTTGEPMLDNEGDDIPGYKLVKTHTVTPHDLETTLKVSTFKSGDVLNIYSKQTPEQPKKIMTYFVDEQGNTVKQAIEGSHPDTKGDQIPDYVLVSTMTKEDGSVVNTYRKKSTDISSIVPDKKTVKTKWLDETGKILKQEQEGQFPDTDGNDINGYLFVRTDQDADGNITNIYKLRTTAVITHYVTEKGVRLADDKVGADFGQPLEIKGYSLQDTRMSKDGREKFYVYKESNNKNGQAPSGGSTSGNHQGTKVSGTLPNTGESSNTVIATLLGLLGISGGGFWLWKSRQPKDDKKENNE